VGFLLDLAFRPDKLDQADMSDDDILLSNIADHLDCSIEYVIEVAAKESGTIFTVEEFFATGSLAPMLRLWLRENNPCPKQSKSKKLEAYRKLKNRGVDIINSIRGHPKQS
jgi:hypothetical protein